VAYPDRIVRDMTGSDLAALRARMKLTQVAFAEELGVHANTLARYERDEIAIPEPVARLAQLLARAPRSRKKRRT
jgi:transcriptional regulator with XRE-family HTH domain